MIEKITPEHTLRLDGLPTTIMPDNAKLMRKINELCDAVNSIVSVQEKLMDSRFVVETKHETPADPYSEQRKWIGKACWFWDDEYDLKTAGVLEEITTIEEEFHYTKKDIRTVWKHCEPVKPDDNIIYKGK